jgi:DNA-binding GntR family transcriptional regulator
MAQDARFVPLDAVCIFLVFSGTRDEWSKPEQSADLGEILVEPSCAECRIVKQTARRKAPDSGTALGPADPESITVPQSLVEAATNAIRDRILDLTLAPGQAINGTTLVAELGLSRTPIREALNRLATEGLLHFETNQGVYVHPLDIAEVNQLCEGFRICEHIAAHFCDFDDPDLLSDLVHAQDTQRQALSKHAYLDASYWNFRQRCRLAETCRNKHLLDFYRKMANQMRRLSILVYRMEAATPAFYDSQVKMVEGLHKELRAAVKARDRQRVQQSLMHHLNVFEERIANAMRNRRGYDLDLS